MAVRRKTENRLTLHRVCHTCGRAMVTTADTPFMRQLYSVDGKKQKTCYFCCEACKRASYKYTGWYDGKAEERRRAKEAARDVTEKNRRYYQEHAEQERERQRKRYWANPDSQRLSSEYNRKKRKLLEVWA